MEIIIMAGLLAAFLILSRFKKRNIDEEPRLVIQELLPPFRPPNLSRGLDFSELLPFSLILGDPTDEMNTPEFEEIPIPQLVGVPRRTAYIEDFHTQRGQIWCLLASHTGITAFEVCQALKQTHRYVMRANSQYAELSLVGGFDHRNCLGFQNSFEPLYRIINAFCEELQKLSNIPDPRLSPLWEKDPALVLCLFFHKSPSPYSQEVQRMDPTQMGPEVPLVLYTYLQFTPSAASIFPAVYIRPFLLTPFLYAAHREMKEDFWPYLERYFQGTDNWMGISSWLEKLLARQGESALIHFRFSRFSDLLSLKIILAHIRKFPTPENLLHLWKILPKTPLAQQTAAELADLLPDLDGQLSISESQGPGELTEV
jgi:hypothetical protein